MPVNIFHQVCDSMETKLVVACVEARSWRFQYFLTFYVDSETIVTWIVILHFLVDLVCSRISIHLWITFYIDNYSKYVRSLYSKTSQLISSTWIKFNINWKTGDVDIKIYSTLFNNTGPLKTKCVKKYRYRFPKTIIINIAIPLLSECITTMCKNL